MTVPVSHGEGARDKTVSIIVVSFNTRELLRECLISVYGDPYPGEKDVWVVDNASTDGSAQLVGQAFPEAHLIANSENTGFARANNQALARARGDFLFLLNSDAALRPGCLSGLVHALASQPDLGLCGPALFNPDGTRQPSCGAFPSIAQEALFQSYLFKLVPLDFPVGRSVSRAMRARYGQRRRVDWLTGAALMFRREVYERIGGLPEHAFMYGEDLEFSRTGRARRLRVLLRARRRSAASPGRLRTQGLRTLDRRLHRGYPRLLSALRKPARSTRRRRLRARRQRLSSAALASGRRARCRPARRGRFPAARLCARGPARLASLTRSGSGVIRHRWESRVNALRPSRAC